QALKRGHVRLREGGHVPIEHPARTLVGGLSQILIEQRSRGQRGAGALQQALQGSHRDIEYLCCSGRGQREHVAENQGGPLAWREDLQRGHESEADALTGRGNGGGGTSLVAAPMGRGRGDGA